MRTKVHPPKEEKPSATSSEPEKSLTESTSQIHCPYRQAMLLQQSLASDKMRVAFLLGAGCPVAIRVPDGKNTKPLIPDIKELTNHVFTTLGASIDYKKSIGVIIERLNDSGIANPNIEDILSHIRAMHDVAGNSSIDGLSKTDLGKLDVEICNITTEVVKTKLPNEITPYHQLATWIGGIKRTYPVEVFTPNYDLLMEQAFEVRNPFFLDSESGFDWTANPELTGQWFSHFLPAV